MQQERKTKAVDMPVAPWVYMAVTSVDFLEVENISARRRVDFPRRYKADDELRVKNVDFFARRDPRLHHGQDKSRVARE
jgi:hypothetical protein